MDTRFLAQNSHWEDPTLFTERDPELQQLSKQTYIYHFPVLETFPKDRPGILTLCGTHLSGKTTLLKSWIKKLIETVPPKTVAIVPCTFLENYHSLQRQLEKQIEEMPKDATLYVILDDIHLVRDWEKGIKPLITQGVLDRVELMLSSSDLTLPQTVQKNFPDFRDSGKFNFHISPLSFRETVLLKNNNINKAETVFKEFDQFLIHGGYLFAINQYSQDGTLKDNNLKNFAEWIKHETEKRGKQERYLREILTAIVKHYTQQTTWNALAQELSIDHPKTIGDYIAMLEALDIVFVQYALLEETLKPAPKKARKLMFTDPFIFHAIQAWLEPAKNHFDNQIKETLKNSDISSRLVEACVITQYRRFFPTYYIKSEGEVDLAYVQNQRYWPIEVTWTHLLRAKDLKQILKYSNGRIFTKTERSGIIQQIKTEPLPLALWQLE